MDASVYSTPSTVPASVPVSPGYAVESPEVKAEGIPLWIKLMILLAIAAIAIGTGVGLFFLFASESLDVPETTVPPATDW